MEGSTDSPVSPGCLHNRPAALRAFTDTRAHAHPLQSAKQRWSPRARGRASPLSFKLAKHSTTRARSPGPGSAPCWLQSRNLSREHDSSVGTGAVTSPNQPPSPLWLMGQSRAAHPMSPMSPVFPCGSPRPPTLAGDRVASQDLVLGAGALPSPRGGQAQAAAAAVVDAALVGSHCRGKTGDE